MTLKTFIEEASKIKGWRINRERQIRCKNGYCPIVAVARKRYPKRDLSNGLWAEAADLIGLTFKNADKVVGAADNLDNLKLRRDILRAFKLKEDPS